MKPILAILSIIALFAFESIAQPWIDPADAVKWSLPSQVHLADKTAILNPSWSTLYDLGWRDAESHQVTEVVTNALPPDTRLTIATYAALMQGIFGPGAHLNTNINEEMVIGAISGNTNVPIYVITALKIARDDLRSQYPGHFAHLPYGVDRVVITNTTTEWRAKP